jgi:hypothetical protein
MTHERLLELVVQVNGALTLVSWPFIIYEAMGKSASAPELKSKLDLRRDQILGTIILDIEEAIQPFWPTPRRRDISAGGEVTPMAALALAVGPGDRRVVSVDEDASAVWDVPTVLSDEARDAVRNCLAKNERLSVQAAGIRRLASRIWKWDKLTFRCTLCTATLALCSLALWFFYEGMTDRLATFAVTVPLSPAILALAAAATRQTYIQKANDAIIEEGQ